ncbi:MAG: HD domain-containing protein [Defluviitaleaceae bacterium]|nr:HD domain-containing protein [Defluviitaleaceae bacterium]
MTIKNSNNFSDFYNDDNNISPADRAEIELEVNQQKETLMPITYESLKTDPQVTTYIQSGNETLKALGFTEHAFPHLSFTAENAAAVLKSLNHPAETIELAKIAGLLHDIGNMMNRTFHAPIGAEIARNILERYGMPYKDIATICSAIGNHDEGTGKPVNAVSAALIIADKSDVRRSRVQETCMEDILADIHDRVNYAVTRAEIKVMHEGEKAFIRLCLDLDVNFTPVMDYFEIFLSRMMMCRRAAAFLDAEFELFINDSKIV